MDFPLTVLAKVVFTPMPPEKGRISHLPFDSWPIEHGKRVPPPDQHGMHFLPDLRFDEDPHRADYVLGLWIEWLEVSADGRGATIRFALRADDDGSFTKYLHPGSTFELFFGRWKEAHGEIFSGPEMASIEIKHGAPGACNARRTRR